MQLSAPGSCIFFWYNYGNRQKSRFCSIPGEIRKSLCIFMLCQPELTAGASVGKQRAVKMRKPVKNFKCFA